ncbi:MAG: hypothetical protein F6J86_13075 [Symploca sp. SIO1B1]|nr:hypothetical protein [Symploca sp. SIO1C2]NER94750.1 hypothetical protein [Symploca sp. SIO1B1]
MSKNLTLTGRMPVPLTYWQDASSTYLLAGCQFHLLTGRMPVPLTYWQDASSTYLLAGCQFHLSDIC